LVQPPPQRLRPIDRVADRRCEGVVRIARFALFADQSAVLQEAEMPRHARLRDAENARQLGDVQPLERHEPQEAEPRLVAEQPVQCRGLIHIYKSTSIDAANARCSWLAVAGWRLAVGGW